LQSQYKGSGKAFYKRYTFTGIAKHRNLNNIRNFYNGGFWNMKDGYKAIVNQAYN
jgi:hypothetical protein